MNDETLKRLDQLAEKLNTTAAHLWAVLVRQARVEAITDVVSVVLFTVGIVVCVKGALRFWRWADDKGSIDGYPLSIILALVATALLVLAVVCLWELPTVLLNPEFYALQQILGAFK